MRRGLAYPQSGEGIRPAVESGLLAAAAIMEAAGDYCSRQLAPYSDRLLARFGPAKAAGGLLPDAVRSFFAGALAGALLDSRWFTRHVVLDRWFLHSRQAAMQAG